MSFRFSPLFSKPWPTHSFTVPRTQTRSKKMKCNQHRCEANFRQTVGCDINLMHNPFVAKCYMWCNTALQIFTHFFYFFNSLLMSDWGRAYQLNMPQSPCQLLSLLFHYTHSIPTSLPPAIKNIPMPHKAALGLDRPVGVLRLLYWTTKTRFWKQNLNRMSWSCCVPYT